MPPTAMRQADPRALAPSDLECGLYKRQMQGCFRKITCSTYFPDRREYNFFFETKQISNYNTRLVTIINVHSMSCTAQKGNEVRQPVCLTEALEVDLAQRVQAELLLPPVGRTFAPARRCERTSVLILTFLHS
jgi:hypothetical protein